MLAWNYLDERGQLRTSRGEIPICRLARVYPAYGLALLAALPRFVELVRQGSAPAPGALAMNHWGPVAATAVTTPLLLQGWFGLLAWNTVGWTLSVEAFFYFTFPFVAPRIGRASGDTLRVLSIALWMIPLLLAALYCFWLNPGIPWGAAWYPAHMSTWAEGFFYSSPLIHWPEFLLGIVLARLFAIDAFRFAA